MVTAPGNGERLYYVFTAPSTGNYVFQSSNRASTADPYGELYNSAQTQIAYNDDGAGDRNFSMTAALTAGQTYYFLARHYGTYSGAYTVSVTVPTPSISAETWRLL